MNRPIGDSRGVCLAEVMIALAAGAVVLAATLQSLDHFQHRLSRQHAGAARTQDLRIGLRILDEEVRLAGTASPPSASPVTVAGEQELSFTANLGGLATTLAEPVSSLQQDLPVTDGTDWAKGKRVLVCDRDRCAESRLARDGRARSLTVTSPLGHDFAAGSDVRIVNQVRYYLRRDRKGAASVMREVDGGATTLIGEITRFQFRYLDRDGAKTADPSRVALVQIEAVAGNGHAVTRNVWVRGR
jgi:Tfp pilus assembly protein PilW